MKKPQLIFHGWLIVATGIVVYTLGYGSRYSFSVIFPSLLEEFQWPRDITAAMLSIHILVYGFVAPVAGHLVDTIGPRKTMVFGTVLLSLGLALSGGGSKPWHFYLTFGFLSGAGLCLIGSVPFTTVIRNWFERKRGLALSLLFLGVGGAFACYPGIAFLIDSVNWRSTFLIEAIIVAGVMLPLIILMVRYHPREKGLISDGVSEDRETYANKGKGAPQITDQAWVAIDWTLPKAARTGRFWLLCLSTFSLWGITEHIMVAHHVAFGIDLGYTRIYASSVLSLFGIMYACGSLAGAVSDRIGREPTMTMATIIGISGIVVLTAMKDTSRPWMLYYYAVAYGFGFGMAAPTIAAAVTDIFQGPKVGAIIGFIWFSFAMGGSIGPWFGGWIFELAKDYMVAFIAAMVLYAVACAAIWWAAPRKVQLVPGWSRMAEKAKPLRQPRSNPQEHR
jgi:MFS family permease